SATARFLSARSNRPFASARRRSTPMRSETGSGKRDAGFSGRLLVRGALVAVGSLLAVPALAQGTAADSGDTAWMLTSAMLVLLTVPGLSLFYGGMVRAKSLLSVLMQCFAITALVSVLWMLYGYSLAFSTEGMHEGVTNLHSFIGGLDRALFAGLTPTTLYGT